MNNTTNTPTPSEPLRGWQESKEHKAQRLRLWARVDAMSPAEYEKWLEEQAAQGKGENTNE